ncbi:hypothetical protein ACQ4LE_008005 [Meloidogyne hapla]
MFKLTNMSFYLFTFIIILFWAAEMVKADYESPDRKECMNIPDGCFVVGYIRGTKECEPYMGCGGGI